MVKEFSDELVAAWEEHRVSKFTSAGKEAALPEPLIRQIRTDCRFQDGSRRVVQKAIPRVACKWLNRAGVSAEYADEVALVTALGAILVQGRKLQTKLDEIIEQKRKLEDEQKKQQQVKAQPA